MDQNCVPYEKNVLSLEEVVSTLKEELTGTASPLGFSTLIPFCALVDVQDVEANVFTAEVNIDRTTLFDEEPRSRIDRSYVGTFLVPFGRGVTDLFHCVGFDLIDREETSPGHGHLTFVRRTVPVVRSGFTSGGTNTLGGSAGGEQSLR